MNSDHIYLAHHGIKGMKWGIRRFRNEDGSLTEAGKKRYNDDGSRRTHRDKLISKYREKGLSQEEAEAAAEKRISVEKKVAIGAGIAAASVAAYATYRYVKADRLDINVNLDSQLKRKTFEAADFDAQINDDLRKINREGMLGHTLLGGRQVNCTSCSMAYEMRRRGYDVVAGKTKKGRSNEAVESFFQNAKFQTVYQNRPDIPDDASLRDILAAFNAPKPSKKDIDDTVQLLRNQGEGARGIIHGQYFCGGAHSIAWEVHNGTVHFVDGQVGRQYKNAQEAIGLMTNVDFLRTDNLALRNTAAQTVRNNTFASMLDEGPSGLVIRRTAEAAAATAFIYDTYFADAHEAKQRAVNGEETKERK